MKISTLPRQPSGRGASPSTSLREGTELTKNPAVRDVCLPARPELPVRLGRICWASTPSPEPAIPDVRGMLARNPRYSELNLGINTAYVALADLFQNIYDPGRECAPSWFGFAPFASREAGGGIGRAERLTAMLEKGLEPPHNPETLLHFHNPQQRTLANFVVALLGPRTDDPGVEGLGDLVHLSIAVGRLQAILDDQPGTLLEKLTRVARTARNMLEDGNRRIVSEIGVAGQEYLEFRQGRQPGPEEVLNEFAARPQEARSVYLAMQQIVEGDGPIVTDWGQQRFQGDRSSFLDASFAAYEAARLEDDPRVKNRWLQQAGVIMAYREQFDTVSPAFTGQVPEGADEVSRPQLMQLMTPWVAVPTRQFLWSFDQHAKESLPPRDQNPFTPRVSEYNWASFPDRWNGILGFFDTVFEQPSTLWPMPHPDPDEPL